MKVFCVGHATFRIEIGGKLIFTDPWFTTSGMMFHLFARRVFPLAVNSESVEKCDVMLVSHGHLDHVSPDAFTMARRLDSLVIGSRGVANKARRCKISRVQELWPGQSVKVEGLTITGIPASHPLSRNALGFLLEGDRSIYFSGDTRFDWSIVNSLKNKKIDVAILQVACSFYSLLGGADGMDVNFAEEMAKAIHPKHVIPMHFDCVGKYLDITRNVRVNESNLDVEDCLESFGRRLAREAISCEILYPGMTFEL
jgi:L-ascorbate metabolism protein UlaG (beta-lactamase superfamily)